MYTLISKWRTASRVALTGSLAILVLLSASAAQASESFNDIWAGIYTTSPSVANGDCKLCHAASNGNLNSYGKALCSSNAGNISSRILDVETPDSDLDPLGASNLAEINAGTQPGWTPGNVNPIYSRSTCNPTGLTEAPPTYIAGSLDPAAGNLPPLADANGPYSGTVGVAMTFDGSRSSDPDGSISAYDWQFGDGSTGTGVRPTHTYLADGTFKVMLTVTDMVGATGTASTNAIIGLGNQPPVAVANGPYSGTVGVAVAFDSAGSSDPDGRIASYSWDFGDGSNGTGARPTHVYGAAGMFNVTLTVTDDSGAADSAASTAQIILQPVNLPPVADAHGPYSGTVGVPVDFDGSRSGDPDGRIVSYSWNFGDGSTGSGPTPSHTYGADGSFTVSLTVTDDAGATGTATTTASIGAGNLPPVADPRGPYSGTVGVPVAFDGNGSGDPDGRIVAYSWDLGDGSTGSGATPNHAYSSDGSYRVSLTVTDDAGATGTATTTASIGAGNLPPVADPRGPYSGMAGMPVAFDGSASSDPDGRIASYSWDFGDGSTGSGASPEHAYRTAGTYNVTLEVMDADGARDSAMTTATIVPSDATGADVFLTKLSVPRRIDGRNGATMSQKVMAIGDGDTLAQDATVSLTVTSPTGIKVKVTPASVTQRVSPDDDATTKYRFRADVSCKAPGTYALKWTATIAAAANSNAGNDSRTATTSVRCDARRQNPPDTGHEVKR
jgi:PKD repeat protein